MLHQTLEPQFSITEAAKLHPAGQILKSRRKHHGIFEEESTELHELVDLLGSGRLTMDRLLLLSSRRQRSVMYSTYRILYLYRKSRNLIVLLMERLLCYSARVTKARRRDCFWRSSSARMILLCVCLNL